MPVKEKQERNKSLVALFVCGLGKHAIARQTSTEYRNTCFFIKKYLPKYLSEIKKAVENFATEHPEMLTGSPDNIKQEKENDNKKQEIDNKKQDKDNREPMKG